MMTLRRSEERGRTRMDWLDSYHTFSFGDYGDRRWVQFSDLRVINEDRVAPGSGFPRHPHRDMEILTWVLEGELEHQDSLGSRGRLKPGELQWMSAGAGIVHSEYNASGEEPVHLLQIWVLPERRDLTPTYEQRAFAAEERRNRFRLLASPGGEEGALPIRQDTRLYNALLDAGTDLALPLPPGRKGWLQVARGAVEVNGMRLEAGDAAGLDEAANLRALAPAEALFFDLR
jgi:quercetin 2,3-dioxygenase